MLGDGVYLHWFVLSLLEHPLPESCSGPLRVRDFYLTVLLFSGLYQRVFLAIYLSLMRTCMLQLASSPPPHLLVGIGKLCRSLEMTIEGGDFLSAGLLYPPQLITQRLCLIRPEESLSYVMENLCVVDRILPFFVHN